jgi:inward rectifier potassium channel
VRASVAPPVRMERRNLDESLIGRLGTDGYHLLRNTDWARLTGFFALVYLGLNLLFASILWLGNARILNAHDGFEDRFVFSVQTMATIGYGYLAPDDWLAHAVVTVESFVSIVFNAVVTGVFFGKFATPRAKVLWSSICVVADEDGAPTLMFRCANTRATALVEATVKVALTRDVTLPHGERARRIFDLQLRRNTSPVFAWSWTVYHKIDESSPLYGRTHEQLLADSSNLIVTLTGIDDSLAATVHARTVYGPDRILFGRRFADVLGVNEDGSRYIDFARFDETYDAPLRPSEVAVSP